MRVQQPLSCMLPTRTRPLKLKTDTMEEHAWEQAKENAAPLATGRSVSALTCRSFGASSHDDEAKTKKYEKIIRRSEKASEWLNEQAARLSSDGDELSEGQIGALRRRLVQELGYNSSPDDVENIDHDPLKYWILYIKHIRTAYPSDTQRQFLLMERCARTFLATPFLHLEYVNDARLIRTCILYADKTSSANEVFKRMNALKVGNKVALFWVAWAWLAEKRGDFSFCEKIFQKALRVGAEPKKFLLEREKQFLRRMSRHWLNTTKNDESLEEKSEECRGALNSLEERGGRVVERSTAPTGFPSRSQRESGRANMQSNSTAGFSIFQDENSVDHNGLDDENNNNQGFQLTKECERTKENKMRAEQWNERGYGLGGPAGGDGTNPITSIVSTRVSGSTVYRDTAAPAPAFDVFVDKEFEDDNNYEQHKAEKSKVDHRSLRQRLDGGTADRIRRDPLRYMKNPHKVAIDQEKYDPVLHSAGAIEAKASKNIVQDKHAEAKQRSGGYDKELLKPDASGHECCFEERRAMAGYYKVSSNVGDYNKLQTQEVADDINTSLMDVDESIEEVEMEDIQMNGTANRLKSALKPSSKASELNTSVANPRRVLFGANTEVPTQINESVNTSTASSQLNGSFVRDREETINTKLANAEISMMFCSPNNNESMSELPGRSFLASNCKKPLFSTSRKENSNSDEDIGTTFSIFQDTNRGPLPASTQSAQFDIFQDENVDVSTIDTNIRCGKAANFNEDETATLSALNEVLDGGGLNFELPNSHPPITHCTSKLIQSSSKFRPSQKYSKSSCDDATASLSDIGALLGDIQSCSIKENQPSSGAFSIFAEENNDPVDGAKFSIHDENFSASPAKKSSSLGFEIFSDDIKSPSSCQKKRKIDEPSFGDISRIDNDEKTSNFQILDENAVSVSNPIDAIDYLTKHKDDMESAMRKCVTLASSSSSDFHIFDYRKQSIPREFLRKSFSTGFTIDLLDNRKVNIIHELGRGVHGVVLLCKDDVCSESIDSCQNGALKIQAPIGSLAHEYSVLLRLEERIRLDSSGFYPFPQSQALYAFKEGGLFVMTAGSDSGMTLLDVVNTCNKSIGSVPEMVAIYYTSRMLRHLECLHRKGRILHCDVKPDNWVLTMATGVSGTGAVAGADLMLVDFGRAIDLDSVSGIGTKPLFTGSVAAEDMECKAMRQGLPWGFDLDFYGLCASSYILLFGSHMEVVQDENTGKLKLKRLLRRYWQRDLWQKYFDTLLNFGARSSDNCLHDLCIAFDEYLNDKGRNRDIESRISTLYTHLPKER